MEPTSQYLRITGTILALLITAIGFLCIERDNPWDPQNGCPQAYKNDILSETKPLIDSSLTRLDSLKTIFETFKKNFDSTQVQNNTARIINDSAFQKNQTVLLKNSTIDSLNSTITDCSLKKSKDTLSYSLQALSLFNNLDILNSCRTTASVESLKIVSLYTNADQQCSPQGVFEPWSMDSTISIIKPFIVKLDSLVQKVLQFNETTREYNLQKINGYSLQRFNYNDSIRTYNLALTRNNVYCGQNRLSDPLIIRDSVAKLHPGDTLFLDSTLIQFNFRFTNMGADTSDTIVIMGSPFMNTVLAPANFFVSKCFNIHFVNLVFGGGYGSGAKIENSSKGILFDNCLFRNNKLSGLEIVDSDVELRNCKITNNGGSGIEMNTNGSEENMLYAKNLLIAHNSLYGIHTLSATVYISNATISDNGKDGIFLDISTKPVILEYSTITFNGASGLQRNSDAARIYSLYNMNFYGNNPDFFSTDSLHPVFNVNPNYEDKDQNNYRILNSSLIYNLNIGYYSEMKDN